MRKSLRKIVPTLISMVMCLTILTPTAMAAENPSLELDASVTVKGALPEIPEDFLIKLTADEMSNPMPEGSLNGISTMNVTGGDTMTFPKITYNRVGTYRYKIWQQEGSNPDCTYDTSIYHLVVFVTNADEGGLEITAILNKEGETEKSSDIVFENSYAIPAQVKLKALKTLDGKIPLDGEFTFYLIDEMGTILQTVSNLGQDVEFDEILLNKIGTKIYYIKEKKDDDPTIEYDDAEYKVTVIITKNSEGNYEAKVSYMKSGVAFIGIPTFANKTVTGELPDTGGDKPGDKPEIPELPKTGEAKSTLPIIGVIMILSGVTMAMKRKTVK